MTAWWTLTWWPLIAAEIWSARCRSMSDQVCVHFYISLWKKTFGPNFVSLWVCTWNEWQGGLMLWSLVSAFSRKINVMHNFFCTKYLAICWVKNANISKSFPAKIFLITTLVHGSITFYQCWRITSEKNNTTVFNTVSLNMYVQPGRIYIYVCN
jgi:hypothetical protein